MVYMYIKHKEISEGVFRIIRSEPQDKSILFMYQKMCLRGAVQSAHVTYGTLYHKAIFLTSSSAARYKFTSV